LVKYDLALVRSPDAKRRGFPCSENDAEILPATVKMLDAVRALPGVAIVSTDDSHVEAPGRVWLKWRGSPGASVIDVVDYSDLGALFGLLLELRQQLKDVVLMDNARGMLHDEQSFRAQHERAVRTVADVRSSMAEFECRFDEGGEPAQFVADIRANSILLSSVIGWLEGRREPEQRIRAARILEATCLGHPELLPALFRERLEELQKLPKAARESIDRVLAQR
jgi:hypothetical protein